MIIVFISNTEWYHYAMLLQYVIYIIIDGMSSKFLLDTHQIYRQLDKCFQNSVLCFILS